MKFGNSNGKGQPPLQGDEKGVFLGAPDESNPSFKPWNETVDVLVVGFGAAGSSAALEASTNGASVCIADRFNGGGSTKRSGGVVYFGGGTELQQQSNFDDSPEEMYKYLSQEVGEAVPKETLKEFCDQSNSNFEWLRQMGISFPSSGKVIKTSYPLDNCTLYYSGNELSEPYRHKATPMPRGHRVIGKGLTGNLLFQGLKRATKNRDITILTHTPVNRLVTNAKGVVIGAELITFPPNSVWRKLHEFLFQIVNSLGMFSIGVCMVLQNWLGELEAKKGEKLFIHAKGGTILCAGGFAFNPKMFEREAPLFSECGLRIGNGGDTGSGILLGVGAGGITKSMDKVAAFRFINPPVPLIHGIIVDSTGKRLCNEELYGAKLGNAVATAREGKAWLIIDKEMFHLTLSQLFKEHMAYYQRIFGFINLFLNREKASSIYDLSLKCGFSPEILSKTIERLHGDIEKEKDSHGKSFEYLKPIKTPPYYAVKIDLANKWFATPHFTLGGLSTEGMTGQVLREDGTPIEGLYAAGRNAVGVCSNSYFSGLSIADCLFSGRNAGRHAANRTSV